MTENIKGVIDKNEDGKMKKLMSVMKEGIPLIVREFKGFEPGNIADISKLMTGEPLILDSLPSGLFDETPNVSDYRRQMLASYDKMTESDIGAGESNRLFKTMDPHISTFTKQVHFTDLIIEIKGSDEGSVNELKELVKKLGEPEFPKGISEIRVLKNRTEKTEEEK